MSELCDNFKWQKIHVIGFFEIKGEMDKKYLKKYWLIFSKFDKTVYQRIQVQ